MINSEALKILFKQAVDYLISCRTCTVPCRLTYPGIYEACTNCSQQNPAIGKKHTNVAQSGSRVPVYAANQCSVCHGTNLISVDSTEILYMIPLWDYKQWFNTGLSSSIINARNPDGMVQTFSKIEVLPQIKRAKSIRIDTNIEQYTKHDFEIYGEPEPIGFGESSYITTLWKKL